MVYIEQERAADDIAGIIWDELVAYFKAENMDVCPGDEEESWLLDAIIKIAEYCRNADIDIREIKRFAQ